MRRDQLHIRVHKVVKRRIQRRARRNGRSLAREVEIILRRIASRTVQ
jgi:hypothetical protein